MADALQAALNAHDRVRKSTDLPLFYGKKEKDTVTPNVLLDRINRAAVIANWNTDERKCTEFYMILRDRALIWWDSLENADNVDRDNWTEIQKEFLAAYAPKFTARTTCTNFQDLTQRTGENVHDYYLRVTEAFKKMCDAKPAAIRDVRVDRGAATEAQATAIKKEGIIDSERFFLHQLFIAGLKEDLRTKIMEAGKTNIQDSLTIARELEVILNDRKKTSPGGVTSVKNEENKTEEDNEELDEEDLTTLNAIRFQRGKPPLKNFRRSGFQARPPFQQRQQGQGQGTPKCRYCKIPGHVQKVCRKRIEAGAPQVDAQGKPYQHQGVKKINGVKDESTSNMDPGVGSISNGEISSLNW